MCQGSLELHVVSHVVLGPLSDVTHLTEGPAIPVFGQIQEILPQQQLKSLGPPSKLPTSKNHLTNMLSFITWTAIGCLSTIHCAR